jgi:hypothetical protein
MTGDIVDCVHPVWAATSAGPNAWNLAVLASRDAHEILLQPHQVMNHAGKLAVNHGPCLEAGLASEDIW